MKMLAGGFFKQHVTLMFFLGQLFLQKKKEGGKSIVNQSLLGNLWVIGNWGHTGQKFAAQVPELFLRAVFFKKDGSIPKDTEVASGVLWKVSSLICCPVPTIFAFFFCSSDSSQGGRIAEHSSNFTLC